jgi:hypothetical protein
MHNGMQSGHTLWSCDPRCYNVVFRLLFYTFFACGSREAFLDQTIRWRERFEMRYHVLYFNEL